VPVVASHRATAKIHTHTRNTNTRKLSPPSIRYEASKRADGYPRARCSRNNEILARNWTASKTIDNSGITCPAWMLRHCHSPRPASRKPEAVHRQQITDRTRDSGKYKESGNNEHCFGGKMRMTTSPCKKSPSIN